MGRRRLQHDGERKCRPRVGPGQSRGLVCTLAVRVTVAVGAATRKRTLDMGADVVSGTWPFLEAGISHHSFSHSSFSHISVAHSSINRYEIKLAYLIAACLIAAFLIADIEGPAVPSLSC